MRSHPILAILVFTVFTHPHIKAYSQFVQGDEDRLITVGGGGGGGGVTENLLPFCLRSQLWDS